MNLGIKIGIAAAVVVGGYFLYKKISSNKDSQTGANALDFPEAPDYVNTNTADNIYEGDIPSGPGYSFNGTKTFLR